MCQPVDPCRVILVNVSLFNGYNLRKPKLPAFSRTGVEAF